MPTRLIISCLLWLLFASVAWSQETDKPADTFVLEIQGLDPGIEVFINGKQLGFTPFSQSLPRTELKLELRHPDWENFSQMVPPPTSKKITLTPQLIHSRPFELKSLKEWREHLVASLEEKTKAKSTWDIVGNVSLCTIAGGVVIAGGSAIATAVVEPNYQAATNSSEASTYRSQIEGWNTAFQVGTIFTILGLLGGAVTLIGTPEINDLQAQIDSIDRQIRSLEIPQ